MACDGSLVQRRRLLRSLSRLIASSDLLRDAKDVLCVRYEPLHFRSVKLTLIKEIPKVQHKGPTNLFKDCLHATSVVEVQGRGIDHADVLPEKGVQTSPELRLELIILPPGEPLEQPSRYCLALKNTHPG